MYSTSQCTAWYIHGSCSLLIPSICDAYYLFILQGMVTAALVYRQSHAEVYQGPEDENRIMPEYVPWTSTSGSNGLRTILSKQVYMLNFFLWIKFKSLHSKFMTCMDPSFPSCNRNPLVFFFPIFFYWCKIYLHRFMFDPNLKVCAFLFPDI